MGLCKNTRCGTDLLTCANCCPCLVCCRIPPEKTVFIAGLEAAGKTTLLYQLMFNKALTKTEPTKGFNNEVITFNKWQSYEFWDPGGNIAQRSSWKRYYSRINFDFLIYVIDATKWLVADAKKKETLLNEDRMELHALLNEMEFRKTRTVIYINAQKLTNSLTEDVQNNIFAELELSSFPNVSSVGSIESLKKAMDIITTPSEGLFC